jgi:hypothetical protein
MSDMEKKRYDYYCKNCNFLTNNRFNFDKHLMTEKHKNTIIPTINKCETCGKTYKYKSGLSRHKIRCSKGKVPQVNNKTNKTTNKKLNNESLTGDKTSTETNGDNKLSEGQREMIKAITETLSKQGQLIEKLVNTQKEMIPKLGNNNNNKISINVFLNEHCKNAMNLTDFINGIDISLEDLEYTNAHGYVKGIGNIFTKNLTDMKVTERPIHCSDKKRLQFYVKEENKWDKDEKSARIERGIQCITHKAFTELKKWEDAHPGYDQINSPENMAWLMMIQKLSSGVTDSDRVKNTEIIKKNMSHILGIKEAIEN